MREMDYQGHLTSLAEEECRQLLAEHCVGRVCWQDGDELQVLPVTYAMHGEQIIFTASPGGVLGHLGGPVPVAFEVDDIDEATATGWSVVARGSATGSTSGASDGVVLPRAWAPGVHEFAVVITPTGYSGRAVSGALAESR
jgi:Predicted flavin-nucleotide-binding protein